jgi:hypothetical protein
MLLAFTNDQCFHCRQFFEADFRGTVLSENLFNVSGTIFVDVRPDITKDLGDIPVFANVFVLRYLIIIPGWSK